MSFLNAANVHDASAFSNTTTTTNDVVVGLGDCRTVYQMSCLPTGAMTLSVDLDVDDAVLEALRRDDDDDDDDGESAVARLNAHAKGGNTIRFVC